MTDPTWLPESEFSSDLPVWTRALVGEMLPEVVSPLGWSLVWESCAALGWRDAMIRRMGFDEDEFSSSTPETIGLIGGYGYLNASHLRVWADRSPDLTVDHIDRILVHNGSPLPGHSRRNWHNPDAVATGMLGQWFRWVMESRNQIELDAGHSLSLACRRARPDFSTLSDLQLVRRATDLQPLCRQLFEQHANQTLASTIGPWVVTEICAEIGQPAHALRLLSGLGMVDSVSPTHALWDLSRLVRNSPGLSKQFDERADGLDRILRFSNNEDAVALVAGMEAVMSEVGYRGPNEWDLASPTWDIAPEIVVALLDCMRHCPDELGPSHRRTHLEADRARLVTEISDALDGAQYDRFLAGIGASAAFLRGRELSRTNVVRVIHEMRLALRELADRGVRRNDFEVIDNIWMLTLDELEYYADGGLADVAEISSKRRIQYDELRDSSAPSSMIGSDDGWIPAPPGEAMARAFEDRPLEPGDMMLGSPGSPGMAKGRARVIETDADLASVEHGDVLVLSRADLAATPLFVAAGAVVTDQGGTFSHAVGVARELGTPMVVGAHRASERIRTGSIVNVDGLTGVVSVTDADTDAETDADD
ncbi:MAG: PEP-utilizing enzyme [Acidimicrobiales bacterium]